MYPVVCSPNHFKIYILYHSYNKAKITNNTPQKCDLCIFTQNWVLGFKHFPLSLSSLCEHNLDYLSTHCAL